MTDRDLIYLGACILLSRCDEFRVFRDDMLVQALADANRLLLMSRNRVQPTGS